jgi:hypothetical protein
MRKPRAWAICLLALITLTACARATLAKDGT